MRVVRSVLQRLLVLSVLVTGVQAQTVGTTIPVGSAPAAIAINPVTNKLYVTNNGSNSVTIIDAGTRATSTLAVGSRPSSIAVNPETNKVYVSNSASPSLMVVNGVTGTVSSTLTVGDVGWTAINPITNKAYVIRYGFGDEVNIILDERYVNTAATRSYQPVSIALNPYTNILYIAHVATGDIVAIDARVDQSVVQDNVNNYPPLLCPNGSGGYRPSPRSTDPDPGPCINITDPVVAVTVNPVADMIYSVSSGTSDQIAVIRGSTLANPHVATFLSPPGVSGNARSIAVNPVSNKVYAVFENFVVVVNAGGGNAMTVIPATGAVAVGINSSTNTVYVPQNNGTLKVIDGGTNAVTANLSIPLGAKAIAVNPVTNMAYVLSDAGVSPVTGAAVAAATIPLTTTIAPLAGNASAPSGSITINAGSSGGFAAPRKVYFQIDSTTGAWQAASGTGPYTASFAGLASGAHTIRAFATNALDAPSIVTDVQNNPLVGMIAAYTFTVSGSTRAEASISLIATPNPSSPGQGVTITASVSGTAGVATGTIDFRDGAASIAGCGSVALASGSATCSTSSLANGAHSITAVYSGDGSYNAATSSAITQTVRLKASASLALSSSSNPSQVGGAVTFSTNVSGSGGPATGSVQFRDGANVLCAPVTLTNGAAGCSTSALAAGTHSITAEYSGDASYNAATSSALDQVVSKLAANVSLSSSANPSAARQAVTFTAVISGSAATPHGVVAFFDGASAIAGCGNVTVSGSAATCSTSTLAAGVHSISAQYSGDSSYDSAGSGALSQAVSDPNAKDLVITQSVSANAAGTGKDVVFDLTAENKGPGTATSVVVTDAVPANSTFVWATPGCGFSSGVVSCNLGSLEAGSSVKLRVVVRPGIAGSATNHASIAGAEFDASSANNTSSLAVNVNQSPVANATLRYRLFSPVTQEHHFTTDLNEYNVLGAQGGWNQEGTVGKVLDNPGSFNGVAGMPYYRLYNGATHWHHWTTDPNEYYTLVGFPAWVGEGVDGYILASKPAGATELFRLLYPDGRGLHHWTIDAHEYEVLTTSYGWIGEPGAGFVIQEGP